MKLTLTSLAGRIGQRACQALPHHLRRLPRKTALTLGLCALSCAALSPAAAQNSVAYGTIHNFDVVNGTGVECHGFEIEIEDLHSHDITYTYNWNHYGTPTITEDHSNPSRPRVRIRYAAVRTNGGWSAYTAVPTNAIAPTDGHRFTNPLINFGGEHFGCGFRGNPTNITYYWLVDDGTGHLVRGEAVNVSTPRFTYLPPAGAGAAQVRVVIPAAPARPVREYGPATFVKMIKTKTHNNREVKLRDLVSDDPDDDDDRNWRNDEPDEVEVEWKLLQTRFGRPDGGPNGQLEAEPEELPEGDEVITRRYEFFKYVGPVDPENGEALAEDVGPDDLHGIDEFADTIVVGEYLGAQMSAFDVDAPVGLIEHLQDGVVNVPYPRRAVVIGGNHPFIATNAGALPAGMTFNNITGELSGTPTESGVFSFTVGATAGDDPPVRRTYTLTIAAAAAALPPRYTVDTVASPLDAGTTTGDGTYARDTETTVTATPAAGYVFAHWTEQGRIVSRSATYTFTNIVNRSLIANFIPAGPKLSFAVPQAGTLRLMWPTNATGFLLQQNSSLDPAGWVEADRPISVADTNNSVTVP
ncbi:MAG TPA: putative Ig domain-containing protein, partial [Methylomirabilota bacterium]|nr:putative Ig domain-containing protein [Methylomirabilota bacterium]